MSYLRSSGNKVFAVLLVGMLLGVFVAGECHQVFHGHDPELCQLCSLHYLYGWLLVGFSFSIFLLVQNLTAESEICISSSSFRFHRSRSPPFCALPAEFSAAASFLIN